MEKANIILNRNLLPWDIKAGRHFMHPEGIRLGTLKLTRLGMKKTEMEEVAELIKRVVVDKDSPENPCSAGECTEKVLPRHSSRRKWI